MKNKILILCCMIPVIAESSSDRQAGWDGYVDAVKKHDSYSARICRAKGAVSECFNNSRPVQAIKMAYDGLTNDCDETKTRRQNATTVLNNAKQNPKSVALVVGAGAGVVLVTGAAVYGTYKAATKCNRWLQVRKAKNVIVNATKADASFLSAVITLHNYGWKQDQITSLMTLSHPLRNVAQRTLTNAAKEARAAKKVIVNASFASRVKASIGKLWGSNKKAK